ncbi:hypothetical protein ACFOQM_23380 [Paenibacillus sp. GCM10012307]|uniref:Uncharacterized protein n=1 Tax=Paenibacillus roseus TaxID=2798579 RepID=A0A934MXG6_9BACL|nr:hypothetical protein [Paenibacillus roseus]MBJ6364167.1 hypothetical protein [Paenibacillus roseus]
MNKQSLISVLTQAREVIISSGESSFYELKPRDKKVVFDLVINGIGARQFSTDGDSDGCFASADVGALISDDTFVDDEIVFFSRSEYTLLDNIRDSLTSFYVGDNQSSDTVKAIDKLVTRLSAEAIFVNLTPHVFTLYAADKKDVLLSVQAEPEMARVSQTYVDVPDINGFPVVRSEYGTVTGIPDPQPHTYYIVSLLVAQALAATGIKRTDILVPDTGAGAVRNESGGIVGTTRFMVV